MPPDPAHEDAAPQAAGQRPVETDKVQPGHDLDTLPYVDADPAPASPSSWPEVGSTAGRYRLDSVLGEGGFGRVYRAHDVELDRVVALKVPRFDPGQVPDLSERFVGEARTVAQLRHPGIVPVFDVGRLPDGKPYLVMEFIEGPTLEAYLHGPAGTSLTVAQVLQWMIDIAGAVAYAHEQGFIHCDLKPANILLDRGHIPRVTDFGLAIHESRQWERKGELSGTLAYMAPEQVRGDAHQFDGRTDIWALGMMLYRMLTGRLPFSGHKGSQVVEEILARDIKPPRQIRGELPADVERIVLKCCARNMAERYGSAAELREELLQALHRLQADKQVARPVAASAQERRWTLGVGVGGLGCSVALTASAALLVIAGLTVRGVWHRELELAQGPPTASEPMRPDEVQAVPEPFELRLKRSTLPRDLKLPGVGAVDVTGTLEISVRNPRIAGRQRLSLAEPEALPLQRGDELHLEVNLNHPAYVYLLRIAWEGRVQPLYPWLDADWQRRPSKENPVDQLQLPLALEWGEPSRTPGIETLLLLARAEPLPPDADVRSWLPPLTPQPFPHQTFFLRFEQGVAVPVRSDGEHAASSGATVAVDEALVRSQRQLAEALSAHFSLVQAVCVDSAGEPSPPRAPD